MRNSVVLRLVSAAALALSAGLVTTAPATAFVGLSDKQADEIAEFIKCKTYLLKGDLKSFNADPDCGKGPVAVEFLGTDNGVPGGPEYECEWEWSYEGPFSITVEDGDYCYPK